MVLQRDNINTRLLQLHESQRGQYQLQNIITPWESMGTKANPEYRHFMKLQSDNIKLSTPEYNNSMVLQSDNINSKIQQLHGN